jgi:hypothetical protein
MVNLIVKCSRGENDSMLLADERSGRFSPLPFGRRLLHRAEAKTTLAEARMAFSRENTACAGCRSVVPTRQQHRDYPELPRVKP